MIGCVPLPDATTTRSVQPPLTKGKLEHGGHGVNSARQRDAIDFPARSLAGNSLQWNGGT
jgi:hypothetical protein